MQCLLLMHTHELPIKIHVLFTFFSEKVQVRIATYVSMTTKRDILIWHMAPKRLLLLLLFLFHQWRVGGHEMEIFFVCRDFFNVILFLFDKDFRRLFYFMILGKMEIYRGGLITFSFIANFVLPDVSYNKAYFAAPKKFCENMIC